MNLGFKDINIQESLAISYKWPHWHSPPPNLKKKVDFAEINSLAVWVAPAKVVPLQDSRGTTLTGATPLLAVYWSVIRGYSSASDILVNLAKPIPISQ